MAEPEAEPLATAAMVNRLADELELHRRSEDEFAALRAELAAANAENTRLQAALAVPTLSHLTPPVIERLVMLADKLEHLPDYDAELRTLLAGIEDLVHDLFNHTRGLREVDQMVHQVNARLQAHANLATRLEELLGTIDQATQQLRRDLYAALEHVRMASAEVNESAGGIMASLATINTAAQAANHLTVVCGYLAEAVNRSRSHH